MADRSHFSTSESFENFREVFMRRCRIGVPSIAHASRFRGPCMALALCLHSAPILMQGSCVRMDSDGRITESISHLPRGQADPSESNQHSTDSNQQGAMAQRKQLSLVGE